jgi:hypothetical protein
MAQLTKRAISQSSDIRELAIETSTGFGSNGPIDACHRIALLVRSCFCIIDEPEELLIDPILQFKAYKEKGVVYGDCDDVATFTACLTYAIGIPTRFKAINQGEDGSFQHVFTEVQIGETWKPLDATLLANQELRYDPNDCIVEYL